jgi:hypothetical protein
MMQLIYMGVSAARSGLLLYFLLRLLHGTATKGKQVISGTPEADES